MHFRNIFFIAAGCAAAAIAQDKVTVPLSNPTQPATVNVRLFSGSIAVTAGAASQVVVETSPASGNRRRVPEPPPGMHRIETRSGIEVVEDHNTVTIGGRGNNSRLDYAIQVPTNCSLKLTSIDNGSHIDVTGVNGSMEVDNLNGTVTLKNVSGSVIAHSLNGAITATLDRVAPDKPMSFTSLNGKIDVTLPADAKARLRLKTDNGSVFSDFDVKMEADSSKPVVEDARGKGGKYRIRMDRGVYGSINGGGPEYRFETMNGDIVIHKK